MNSAQQHRQSALLRATGYEESEALTTQSTDGEIPHGRELSLSWLAGTVMTGLTSVMLMGAALYMAFQGQDTFSTPFDALQIENRDATDLQSSNTKTRRLIAVSQTRSEREIIEASIRVDDGGVSRIKRQPFDRIRATLSTSATSLSADIPVYDPVALLSRTQSQSALAAVEAINTDIYGANVEGEITVRTASMPLNIAPRTAISDQGAAEFVRLTVEGSFEPDEISALGYAAQNSQIVELGSEALVAISGIAENVTVMAQSSGGEEGLAGRSERILTIRDATPIQDALAQNGFTPAAINAVLRAAPSITPTSILPVGAHLRILLGPNRSGDSFVPYRVSIYIGDAHAATVALTDSGQYVQGQQPSPIEFPEEDTEEVNVNGLPSIYRSIWETARKYDLTDTDIDRIVAMYAYDLDLTERISAGDSVEILQSEPTDGEAKQLLYVSLSLGGVSREFFRFRTEENEVDFFDPDGETGKRFLTRRPLEGGGNLRSRFGYRIHPIFRTRRLHSGIDLSAPRGTPIYASGDGIVKRAQWVSGYGRFVELQHVNGYGTRYGHMTRIASGMAPGVAVRQGQIIGYVGSTGNSTGPHLHFEIRVNDRPVNPLSVRLPRATTLPARDHIAFAQTVDQIRELMARETESVTIASN